MTELEKLRAENEMLKRQVAELDGKLNEAYALKSREASLEAEKLRTNLKKSFSYLFEDMKEYESCTCTEDNFASIFAILKKCFRALKSNGITFGD